MTAAGDGDLPHGDHLVCPRCGTAVGEAVWCSGCGLNLKQQGDLPTGDAYAAKVRERRWLDEQERQARNQREAEAARKAAERERAQEKEQPRNAAAARRQQEKERWRGEGEGKPRRKRRWLAGTAVVAVLVLAAAAGAFALTGGFDSTDEESASPAAQTPDPEPDEMETGAAEPDGEVFFTDLAGETKSEPAELLIFQQIPVLDLEWESWGAESTQATGIAARSDCEPNCAEGSIVGSDITITLSGIQECGGRRQYSEGSYVLDTGQGQEERGTFENDACGPTTSGNGTEFEPLTGESPITTEGIGPVLVGMSLAEAEDAAGTDFLPDGPPLQGCRYFRPHDLGGVLLMVIDDEVARVDVEEPGLATLSGIEVGDSESAVPEEYGEQITSEPSELNPDFEELTFTPSDPSDDTRMVFTTDGSTVTAIRAGRLPEVGFVEGCV